MGILVETLRAKRLLSLFYFIVNLDSGWIFFFNNSRFGSVFVFGNQDGFVYNNFNKIEIVLITKN